MPKKPSSGLRSVASTVRFTVVEHQWLMRYIESHPETGNLNQVLRVLVSDARTWFGLPDMIRSRLEADAKAHGQDMREYVIDVLVRRFEVLVRESVVQEGSPRRKAT